MNIVVIIPTYNEKENILKMIPLLEEEIFPSIKNHNMKILVADDQSPDGTADEVERLSKKWKNIELLSGNKQGLGAAYARAMKYAMEKLDADAVIEIDADFQHDPRDIPRFIKEFDKGADHVIGSRYIPGGEIPPQWALHRKLMSFFGGLFARYVLFHPKIHDMTSGYKLTRTSFLKKVDLDHLYSKYYAYKIHITHDLIKAGAKVKEIPIIFYERKEGSSKISQKDLVDSFYVVLKLRARDSKRVIKFLLVGGTGFMIQLITQEGSIATGLARSIAEVMYPFVDSIVHTDIQHLTDAVGAGIGAEFAILSNYSFNNFWTFDDTRTLAGNRGFFGRLVKFNIASMASIGIQFMAVFIAERNFGVYATIFDMTIPVRIIVVIPTIILIVIPLNYLIYNKIIWKTHRLKSKDELAQQA